MHCQNGGMTLAQRQGGSHRRPSIEAASDRAPAPGHTSASRASSTSAAHHRDQQPNSPLHSRSNALLPPLRLADSPPPAPSKDPLLQLQHPPSRSLAPPATTTLAPSVAPQHQARTKSVSTASPPKLQRPPLGSRANSAPQVPKQSPYPPHGGAKNGHVARARHPDVSDSSSDDDGDSISRDPFFLRYQSVIQRLADQSPGDPDDPLRKSPEQQKRPSAAMDVQARTLPASARSAPAPADRRILQAVDDINIGVIGDSKVGKTRFIDRAFDLRSRSQVRTATRKMSIDGTVYTVRLVEVPFEELDIEHDDRICWPEKIDDMPAPRIDGALMLYDVMNQESLAQVPGMLSQYIPHPQFRQRREPAARSRISARGPGIRPPIAAQPSCRASRLTFPLPLHRCRPQSGVAVRPGRLQVRQPPGPSPGGSSCGGAAREDAGWRLTRVSELRRLARKPANLSFCHAAGHSRVATG